MAKYPPPQATRDAKVQAFIDTKNDAGDLTAAMIYQPGGSQERIAARAAYIRDAIQEASLRFK